MKAGIQVPIGVPGVLHLAGAGLSHGYLGQTELTAASFFPHPQDPDTRIYCTGDLVILREDGDLEYLHRVDGQVKLRGYRIELGEIESVLSENRDVDRVVANVWSGG